GRGLGRGGAGGGGRVSARRGQRGGDSGTDFLGRGGAMGKYLHVDSRLVHFLQAQTAKIIEPFVGLITAARLGAGEVTGQLPVPVMLFDGDDRTIRFFHHGLFPNAWSRLVETVTGAVTVRPRGTATGQKCLIAAVANRLLGRWCFGNDGDSVMHSYAADFPCSSSGRRTSRHFDSGPGAYPAGRFSCAFVIPGRARARRAVGSRSAGRNPAIPHPCRAETRGRA